MTDESVKKAVTEAMEPFVESLDKLTDRVDAIARQRTLAFVVAGLGLVVAIVSILYALNREAALQEQITVNRGATCSQAKVTALAPRKDPIAGESRNHYLNRLEAQREQLIAAGGLSCPSLPGFATFPYLRAQALDEIEGILRHLAPEKLRRALGVVEHGSSQPASSAPVVSSPVIPATGGGAGPGSPKGLGDSKGGSGPKSPAGNQPPSGEKGGGGGGGSPPSTSPSSPPESGGGTGTSPPPESTPAAEPKPEEEKPPPESGLGKIVNPITCGLDVLGKPLLCAK